MTKDELKTALDETEAQRDILMRVLEELEGGEPHQSEPETKEETSEPEIEPVVEINDIKKVLHNAIASGNLKNVLEKIAGGMDFSKTALKSFSDIIDKTRDKLEGNIDEVPGPTGIPIMTDMWLPMFLTLLQTQEFQHIIANMIAKFFKDS
ncbi:MAG: hypothetical protein PHE70_03900 [Tepidanaerobacteraceae bacterium]|nr:hypothetical protein [Tepidanaerobacteraceae bacterium]